MQITQTTQTRSIVLTRDVANLERFPGPSVQPYTLMSNGLHKLWSDLNYRNLRRITSHEQRFYRHQLRQFIPDVLHAHFAVDAAYFIDLKRSWGSPLVVSCYGYDVSSFPHQYLGLGRHYLHRVWQSADVVLAMSNDMRFSLLQLGCPSEKIRVHYHGIDLTRFVFQSRTSTSDQVIILFVGSLDVEKKGVEYLIRAFAEVANRRPHVQLRLIGKGQENAEKLVRSFGLENKVSFGGFVRHDQLPAEYAAADIFCHPSVTSSTGDKEGIPGTIVEAMGTGLPIVTTRHAGIPEMVVDGRHGFTVAERDVSAIAQALIELIDNPVMRKTIGVAAAKQAQENADAKVQAGKLETIYQLAIEKREEYALP